MAQDKFQTAKQKILSLFQKLPHNACGALSFFSLASTYFIVLTDGSYTS